MTMFKFFLTAAFSLACFGAIACSSSSERTSLAQLLYPGITRDVPKMFYFIREELNTAAAVSTQDSLSRIEVSRNNVDRIYARALEVAAGDHLRACALAGLGCLTHRKIPLRFGPDLPLTFESDSTHLLRLQQIPADLFKDTPAHGDADKLQHFFLSAYLALRSDSPTLANFSGQLIEGGESLLINEQENDARDLAANALGRKFARALQMNIDTQPSEILRLADD